MNCPVCKNSMIILELNQVEIDYCASCKGIWLDKGELDLLYNSSDNRTAEQMFHYKNGFNEQIRKCPICKKKMEKVEFENSGIILDRCKKEHGLWFDNGELKSLLSTSSDSNNKMVNLLKEIFGD